MNKAVSCLLLALLLVSAKALSQTAEQAFERAMAARERGELHEAIRGLHAILARHPGLNRARLELAVAYYQALDHRAALEHARRVLADPTTPEAVRANVRRLVASIEADARTHSWSGFASAGWLYDSNVSAGPASPSYEVGGTIIALDAGAVKRGDHAATLSVGGAHRYLSPLRLSLGGREGALLWLSQAALHAVDYFDESAFDLRVLTLTTGPAWIAPPRLRASAPLQLDRLELGGTHYLDIAGASPAVTFTTGGRLELQLDGQLQKRDFKRAVDAGRDSGYRSAGLQAGRPLSGFTLQAGVRAYRDDADDARFDSRGSELFGVLGRPLGERASAYARLAWQRTRYDEPDPLAATGRTDRERRLSLGASWRLGATADDPWSVNLSYLDTRHRSNLALYAFTRRQVGAWIQRVF
jgi:hypothetical protein